MVCVWCVCVWEIASCDSREMILNEEATQSVQLGCQDGNHRVCFLQSRERVCAKLTNKYISKQKGYHRKGHLKRSRMAQI